MLNAQPLADRCALGAARSLLTAVLVVRRLGGMLYLMPLVGLKATNDPKTCGLFCDDEDEADSGGGSRRRLASGPIEPCQVKIACNPSVFNNSTELETQFDELRGGENGTAGYNDRCAMCEAGRVPVDISPEGTLWSIVLFGLIGWTVLLLQALMLRNVNGRMMHIITLHGADEDSQVNELLERLQKNLIEHAQTQNTPEDADSFGEVDEENEVRATPGPPPPPPPLPSSASAVRQPCWLLCLIRCAVRVRVPSLGNLSDLAEWERRPALRSERRRHKRRPFAVASLAAQSPT